jgi:hypothetical protein
MIMAEEEAGRALWGWSPPARPAATPLERQVDRILPRTGVFCALYFLAVVALLSIAPHLPGRADLAVDGMAALAAGSWCVVNFWRCRQAHCVVDGVGWLGLALLAFVGAGLGHSVIGGYEQSVFLGVLVAALAFEGVWCAVRGTNAVTVRCQHVSRSRASGEAPARPVDGRRFPRGDRA